MIIYDDFTSAARANAVLQRSAPPFGHEHQMERPALAIGYAGSFPPTAEEALNEAIDAHLIVFAGVTTKFPSRLVCTTG